MVDAMNGSRKLAIAFAMQLAQLNAAFVPLVFVIYDSFTWHQGVDGL
jgi:hypothetical protein